MMKFLPIEKKIKWNRNVEMVGGSIHVSSCSEEKGNTKVLKEASDVYRSEMQTQ